MSHVRHPEQEFPIIFVLFAAGGKEIVKCKVEVKKQYVVHHDM